MKMLKKKVLGYTDREKMSEAQIRKAVDKCIKKGHAPLVLGAIVDLLYGPEADENWGPGTLDVLSQTLGVYGLTP